MTRDDESVPSTSQEDRVGLLHERPFDSESEDSNSDAESLLKVSLKLPSYASALSAPCNRLSTSLRVILWRGVIFLVPSFLQGRHAREQICPSKLAPTAYLDGMRGLAALFVFFCHYFYQAFTIAKSWGTGEDNYHFLKLPIVRLWYQGPPAVCVFFIISGYALSYRPLKLIRDGAMSDLATTMSSLTFRRGIRLYLPTAISTLMIIILLRMGAYEWTRAFAKDRTYMKNIVEPHPARMKSAYAQYRDWAIHMYNFIHVFDWNKFGGSTCKQILPLNFPTEAST